jgi:hypothetical protein
MVNLIYGKLEMVGCCNGFCVPNANKSPWCIQLVEINLTMNSKSKNENDKC